MVEYDINEDVYKRQGYDMPKKLQGLMGNTYPGKIWQSFMNKEHEGLEPLEFLPYARISDDLLQQQESGSGQPEDNPAEEIRM